LHNTEDIRWWYEHGCRKEAFFIEKIAPMIGIDAQINPEKETKPTAPDLLVDGLLAELKTQETPFFTAQRYGIDPQYAVTFNQGDYLAYKKIIPEMDIYFMVDWQQLTYHHRSTGRNITVAPLKSVYRVNFTKVASDIESGRTPLHAYLRRVGDARNETHSFIFDLRTFQLVMDFTDRPELVVPQ
jgi:hypothetical protein